MQLDWYRTLNTKSALIENKLNCFFFNIKRYAYYIPLETKLTFT